MNYIPKVRCPIHWYCKIHDKEIKVSQEAIYHIRDGWICDCGLWIKKTSYAHKVVLWGFREGYEPDDTQKEYLQRKLF
jgi:hypothetical protein